MSATTDKAFRKAAAADIAHNALVGVRLAPDASSAQRRELEAVAAKVTTQDAPKASKRIWGAVSGAVAVVLMAVNDPAITSAISQHLPVLGVSPEAIESALGKLTAISGLAAVVMPLWSKVADVRPVREMRQ